MFVWKQFFLMILDSSFANNSKSSVHWERIVLLKAAIKISWEAAVSIVYLSGKNILPGVYTLVEGGHFMCPGVIWFF